jgi:hypothetical protein
MTRTLQIVCSLILSAVAPVLAAMAIGNLDTGAAVESSCVGEVRAPAAPKVTPKVESGFCSATASEVRP